MSLSIRCNARSRSGKPCRCWPLVGKRRCKLHGGASTGAVSPNGKQRQAEGREAYLRRLRAQGRRPGPPKGNCRRPRNLDPVEQLRLDTLAALGGERR